MLIPSLSSIQLTPAPLLGNWAHIRARDDNVVVPLLVLAPSVAPDVQVECSVIDLQGIDVSQAQIWKVRHQLAIEPASDAPIPLAGFIRLEHELIAEPLAQLLDHVLALDECRSEVARLIA